MKLIAIIILMLISFNSFSQEKILESPTLQNDSISQEQQTKFFQNKNITDSLKTSFGDTLDRSIFDGVNKLDEVTVKSKSRYNALSLGIIQKEIKPLSQNERRLYTAGDFKPIHLLSLLGGSLQVDPIINAISGRTKRLKKYIQVEKKENNLLYLQENFTDYMLENLKIDKQLLGRFLNVLIENEKLQILINRKDNGEIFFFIGDEWLKFKAFQNKPCTIQE